MIKGDGQITTEKNIVLAILTADCAPIFIFDTKGTFICSLHSGWKGCLKNIIEKAIKKIILMRLNRSNLIAIVGPCLAKENFEVDNKLKNLFKYKDTNYDKYFLKKPNQKKYLFDMRGLINYLLKGCLIDEISNVDIDTYQNNNLFFSHRYSSHNKILPTGRMINMIRILFILNILWFR